MACPNCGSRHLRPSRYRDDEDRANPLSSVTPLRCRDCRTRFFSRTVFVEDIFYARCPKCMRMDLNGWTGKTFQPVGWTAIWVALGAHRWRCEYCRFNFASFRKRKEIFTFSRWKKRNPQFAAEQPVEKPSLDTAPGGASPDEPLPG